MLGAIEYAQERLRQEHAKEDKAREDKAALRAKERERWEQKFEERLARAAPTATRPLASRPEI